MDSLSSLAAAMRDQIRSQREPAPVPEPIPHTAVTYEKFLKLDPPTFDGKPDPDMADNWVKEVERVFEVLSVPDDKKTLFGTFRLKDKCPQLVGHGPGCAVSENFAHSLGSFQKGFLGELLPCLMRGRRRRWSSWSSARAIRV